MGETVDYGTYKETLLTKCDIFSMKRLDIEEKADVIADEKSFVSLVALEGNGVVMHDDTCVTLYKGESLFIPASFGKVEILGNVTVLESRVN
jgi:mannose-6-phosphate isomerase